MDIEAEQDVEVTDTGLPQADLTMMEVVDVMGDLAGHAAAIADLKAKSVECILKIGEHLADAHRMLAGIGRKGQFRPWVEKVCGFTVRSAYNYIGAFETFGKCETVSHFDVKALYLLSANSCPEGAAKAAIRKSKDGTHITHTMAADIKRRHEKIESRKHDDDHDDLDGEVHAGDGEFDHEDDHEEVAGGDDDHVVKDDDHDQQVDEPDVEDVETADNHHDDVDGGDDDHPALELIDSIKKDIEKLATFVKEADKGLMAQRERAVRSLQFARKYVSEATGFFRPKRVRR